MSPVIRPPPGRPARESARTASGSSSRASSAGPGLRDERGHPPRLERHVAVAFVVQELERHPSGAPYAASVASTDAGRRRPAPRRSASGPSTVYDPPLSARRRGPVGRRRPMTSMLCPSRHVDPHPVIAVERADQAIRSGTPTASKRRSASTAARSPASSAREAPARSGSRRAAPARLLGQLDRAGGSATPFRRSDPSGRRGSTPSCGAARARRRRARSARRRRLPPPGSPSSRTPAAAACRRPRPAGSPRRSAAARRARAPPSPLARRRGTTPSAPSNRARSASRSGGACGIGSAAIAASIASHGRGSSVDIMSRASAHDSDESLPEARARHRRRDDRAVRRRRTGPRHGLGARDAPPGRQCTPGQLFPSGTVHSLIEFSHRFLVFVVTVLVVATAVVAWRDPPRRPVARVAGHRPRSRS